VKYDVSANVLLSDDAKALFENDPAGFAGVNELAEVLLELDTDPTYLDEPERESLLATKIGRAVTLQVNYQVATGIDAFVKTTDGPMEVRDAFRSVRGEQPSLHPQARMIRDQVRAAYAELNRASVSSGLGFGYTLRSVR
jgi:hypothetical protein